MFGRVPPLVCLLMLPLTAAAQAPSASTSATQATQQITEALEQKLALQGFTDVQIAPGSFVVTAKDKDGDPITMLISPNSTMVVLPGPGQVPGAVPQQQAEVPTRGEQNFKWY